MHQIDDEDFDTLPRYGVDRYLVITRSGELLPIYY
jgi:hypothetical protein